MCQNAYKKAVLLGPKFQAKLSVVWTHNAFTDLVCRLTCCFITKHPKFSPSAKALQQMLVTVACCVKSVRIRSCFSPYFSLFGLNTERYSPNRGTEKLWIRTLFMQLVVPHCVHYIVYCTLDIFFVFKFVIKWTVASVNYKLVYEDIKYSRS